MLNSASRPDHSALLQQKVESAHGERFVSWSANDFTGYRSQLKLGKAAGMDGLASEHLKSAPVKIDFHLALIFNALVRHAYLPDDFMPVRIAPIVKSTTGDLSSSKNYRPVAIATANSKMVEIALLDKLQDIPDIPGDNQFGFRKGSSTDQCIFLLKERTRRYVQLG